MEKFPTKELSGFTSPKIKIKVENLTAHRGAQFDMTARTDRKTLMQIEENCQ